MRKLKTILFSAILAFGISSFANACGKLVIAEQNWASAELMANVDKIIPDFRVFSVARNLWAAG